MKYVTQESKTSDEQMTGIRCTAESTYEEMVAVKTAWGKLDGRQHIQFIQSFAPNDPIAPELAHQIGLDLANKVIPSGFQAIVVTHVDRDHIHNHVVINSVNMDTGLKWKQGRDFLLKVREVSDTLCRANGMNVQPPPTRHDRMPLRGEFEAERDGRSWKHELRATAWQCLVHATSRESFIEKMAVFNCKVHWSDTRKHVLFENADGMKCRGRLFGPQFSKESIEAQFDKNRKESG